MELAFADRSLRQICEDSAKADRHFGVKVAEKLRRRLTDIRAVACVKDLIAGRPRELKDGRFAVEVFGGVRIVFCANHNSNPQLKSGAMDWCKVGRVKILTIESNHDNEQ